MGRFNFGVVFVGVISTLCGLGMTGVSSWILHKTLQMQKNANLDHAKDILEQLENFSGVKTGLHNNFDPIFRILISTSAAALAGGCVQFITSFCLLLCGVSGKLRRWLAMSWIGIEILCLLCVGGAVLCILTNELKMNDSLAIFMISAGADVLVIIASCAILACSGLQDSSDSSGRRDSRFIHDFPPIINGGKNGGKTKASAPSLTLGKDVDLSVQDKITKYENNRTLMKNEHPSSMV